MKVHFSAPLKDIQEHMEAYKLVVDTIKSAGHVLANNWLNDFQQHPINKSTLSAERWENIAADTLAAIEAADAVVVEASLPSFSMGYISALTLSHKKPLLMLFNSRRQPYILDSNNSLKRAEVFKTDGELQQIVASFLNEIDVDAKNLRFNMALDRETYNFLNWESVNTGKTKAQVIREVLKDRIHHKD